MKRYVLIHSVIRTNPKFRGLPTDAARLAYIESLVAAVETDPSGEWLNSTYYLAGVGPSTGARLEELLDAGLLVRLDDGRIAIPAWKKWQSWRVPSDELSEAALEHRRAKDAARARKWRDAHKDDRDASRDNHATRDAKRSDKTVTRDGGSTVGANGAPPSEPDRCSRCGALRMSGEWDWEVALVGGQPVSRHRNCPPEGALGVSLTSPKSLAMDA